jgi:hypothetical protein
MLLFDVWTPDDWDSLIVPTLTARRSVGAVLTGQQPTREQA